MTKQNRINKAVIELKAIAAEKKDDPESAHSDADEVLCDLLTQLGCTEVVNAWRDIEKWYA